MRDAVESLVERHLATFEAFSRLGFETTCMSIAPDDLRTTVLKVGEVEFRARHTDQPESIERAAFDTAWTKALAAWGERSPGDRARIYRRSYTAEELADLAKAIDKKGIPIPALR